MKKVRTRFAPSPTGYLHIGGARTALFSYLFARHYGGDFILRIEDTDQKRSTEESTVQVIESMKWLGLKWDEGPEVEGKFAPYYQSKRLSLYEKYLQILKDKGLVYPCFCSEELLKSQKEKAQALNIPNVYDRSCLKISKEEVEKRLKEGMPHTYRFRVPLKEVIFEDGVKGKMRFESSTLGDFVVMKQDGFPTYNFAVVVDDIHMEITHILRGDDHLSNTPKQILLYEALGADIPKMYHISMILGEDKEKMSKRHGATSVLDFDEKGYVREALINFISLLGWSTGDDEEILPLEEIIKRFDGSHLAKSPAVFDYKKLDFMSGYYLRQMPIEEAVQFLLPFLKKAFMEKKMEDKAKDWILNSPKRLSDVVGLVRDHCKKGEDVEKYVDVFIDSLFEVDPDSLHYLQTEEAKTLLNLALEVLSSGAKPELTKEDFVSLQERAKALGIKGKGFFKPLRVVWTGKEEGYELDTFFSILSRDSLLYRLRKFIS